MIHQVQVRNPLFFGELEPAASRPLGLRPTGPRTRLKPARGVPQPAPATAARFVLPNAPKPCILIGYIHAASRGMVPRMVS